MLNKEFVEARKNAILGKEFWTTDETEFFMIHVKGLQTTSRTLRTLVSRGSGPKHVKFGRSVRYTRDEIEAWIKKKLSEPKSFSLEGGQK
jgi:predicted DNA-binding transcriptional regulator AlpA